MSRPTLKELITDPDVMHLQRLLLANGYGAESFSVSGYFDRPTASSVEIFQLQHIDRDRLPLMADGVVGEKTWWALEHPSGSAQQSNLRMQTSDSLNDPRRKLLDLLAEEHAKVVVETPDGSNRSPDIDLYWGDTGLIGRPWACAFVSWALFQAFNEYPIGGTHHVSAQDMWREARRLGFAAPDPKPGDLFVITASGGKGHTGFVLGVSYEDDLIYTCEGNAGNRLKFGRRNRKEIDQFIDYLQDGQSLNFNRFDPDLDGIEIPTARDVSPDPDGPSSADEETTD